MSMDLEVWSAREINLPSELPQESLWQQFGEEFSYEGDGWLVSVLTESSEPPGPVEQVLPDASYVTYVTLEPIGAGPEGYAFLEQVVRSLAEKSAGVWVDPGGDAYLYDQGTFG